MDKQQAAEAHVKQHYGEDYNQFKRTKRYNSFIAGWEAHEATIQKRPDDVKEGHDITPDDLVNMYVLGATKERKRLEPSPTDAVGDKQQLARATYPENFPTSDNNQKIFISGWDACEKQQLKNAVEVLTEALRADKSEGSYYYTWQANIAMAFSDAYFWKIEGRSEAPTGAEIHEISNRAAKHFLDLLCSVPEPYSKTA